MKDSQNMMYINKKQTLWINNQTNIWENEKFKIHWQGCLFIPGIPVGQRSIKFFAKEIEIKKIEKSCHILYGNFYCVVYNKKLDTYSIFTDNSRQSSVFYNLKNNFISSSFLHLVKLSHLETKNILPSSIVEFILTGFIFTSEIFFKNIKIIKANEIITFRGNNSKIILKKKNLKNIFIESKKITKPKNFIQIFQKIADSLKGNKISITLTGGTDSRTLVTIFHDLNVNFETAVSGVPTCPDVLISNKVAKIRKLTHYTTTHIIDSKTFEEEINKNFYLGDGLIDVLQTHRLYQFEKDKQKRKIDFSIGGSGGELYKDGGWWRIAFVRKNKKNIINSLINSGLIGWGLTKGKIPNNIFHKKLLKLAINYKKDISKKLKNRFATNNQQDFYKMADQIFYEYSVRSPRGFNQRLIKNYNPLLERNIVKLGINILNKERFSHIFYRKIVTSIDPKIAKIKTTRGASTMHSGIYYIIKDTLKMFLINNMFKKLFKKREVAITNPQIYKAVKNSSNIKNLFLLLQKYKIINEKIKPNNIDNKYLGRLITLGMLIKYIEKSKDQKG